MTRVVPTEFRAYVEYGPGGFQCRSHAKFSDYTEPSLLSSPRHWKRSVPALIPSRWPDATACQLRYYRLKTRIRMIEENSEFIFLKFRNRKYEGSCELRTFPLSDVYYTLPPETQFELD